MASTSLLPRTTLVKKQNKNKYKKPQRLLERPNLRKPCREKKKKKKGGGGGGEAGGRANKRKWGWGKLWWERMWASSGSRPKPGPERRLATARGQPSPTRSPMAPQAARQSLRPRQQDAQDRSQRVVPGPLRGNVPFLVPARRGGTAFPALAESWVLVREGGREGNEVRDKAGGCVSGGRKGGARGK